MKGIERVLGLEIILICEGGRFERVGCGLHSAASTCMKDFSGVFNLLDITAMYESSYYYNPSYGEETFLCYVKPAVYGLNIPYHYFKFDSRQPYFMAYCIESLQQPFFN